MTPALWFLVLMVLLLLGIATTIVAGLRNKKIELPPPISPEARLKAQFEWEEITEEEYRIALKKLEDERKTHPS